jgi:hypothetical protein
MIIFIALSYVVLAAQAWQEHIKITSMQVYGDHMISGMPSGVVRRTGKIQPHGVS